MKMNMKVPSRENVPDDEIAFRVNYNPKLERYISVNGHIISRPHFTGVVSTFFEYIYENANRTVTSQEVERVVKIKLKKDNQDHGEIISFGN